MKQYHEILTSLDTNQQQAATIDKNAVIAAGAGSGKTRVLSARYVHLVVERGLAVDQILTLTFTTKAAAEMYSRIHATLRETDHPNARAALESFHLAKSRPSTPSATRLPVPPVVHTESPRTFP